MANPTKLSHHAFPAHLTDLSQQDEQDWSDNYISNWMGSEIAGGMPGPAGTTRTALSQFFDGTQTAYDQSQPKTAVTWVAFPNLVTQKYGDQKYKGTDVPLRWIVADLNRLTMDEYLEWSVSRVNNDGSANPDPYPSPNGYASKVTNIAFTCEGPEYWQFVADKNQDKLVELYQTLNPAFGSQITKQQLFPRGGDYQPENVWNKFTTTGTIAHLIHPSNTLGAEIDIAAQATVIRKYKNGQIIKNENDLINCSQYGNPGRNSDPHIGISVNSLALSGLNVTITDPVALYINSFDTSNFQLDYSGVQDGSDLRDLPDGIIRVTRGDLSSGTGLRIDVSVPATDAFKGNNGAQLTVSDIYDGKKGFFIHFGAQLADYILMSVSVNTIQGTTAAAVPCPGQSSHPVALRHILNLENPLQR